jgi:ABC-type antimicrobial peptide transport system permease subunit
LANWESGHVEPFSNTGCTKSGQFYRIPATQHIHLQMPINLAFFWPKKSTIGLQSTDMIKNYILIALRHVRRHKLFALINILCLAIGLSFSLVIGVYILQQKEINAGLRNADRQYIIKSRWKEKTMGMEQTSIGPFAETLHKSYPGLVANYFRYNPVTNVVSAGDKHFKENFAICDTTLVSMFGFPLLYGNPVNAFPTDNSAVITESLSKKLFGNDNPVGKTISILTIGQGNQDYTVSAVLKDMRYNSINNLIDKDGYSVFLPFAGSHYYSMAGGAGQDDWTQIFLASMIELKPGVTAADLATPAKKILSLHLPKNLKDFLEPEFAPVKDYYLNDNNGAVRQMIVTLSLIAAFILVMAVINFVNINIGTSSYRIKEIGLRKVFGGARRQLIAQHLIESLALTFVAGVISVALYEISRPCFSQLLHAPLDSLLGAGYSRLLLLLALIIAVGCLSGIYPAFILSSADIIHSVKGKIDTARGGLALRKALLITQFTLAVTVFISALNVSKQVSYIFDKDLGYKREQLVVMTVFPKQWDSAGIRRMETVRNEMETVSHVSSASLSFEVPDRTPPNSLSIIRNGSTQTVQVPAMVADENFGATYGLQLTKGNFFDDYKRGAGKDEIVLNETAARAAGVTGINQVVRTSQGFTYKVSGIVKDYNYSSFEQRIGPLAILHMKDNTAYRYLTLKINGRDLAGTIAALREKWRILAPGSPFDYNFMDARFRSLYESEVQLKQATNIATILNLVIVFMGIFGVVAFTLARRSKEISIRKVLGADAGNIIALFLKEYTGLILIANVIGWPLAYLATGHWLNNYSYRMQQDLVPYFSVLAIVLASAFFFIAAQCFRVAIANPVRNLRTE